MDVYEQYSEWNKEQARFAEMTPVRELLDMCIALNRTGFYIGCDYSGHVEMVTVWVSKSPGNGEWMMHEYRYLDGDDGRDVIGELMKQLITLSEEHDSGHV